MHRRQAQLITEAQSILTACGCQNPPPPADTAVWEDPSTYDMTVHGPPYLPKMSAADRESIRKEASAKKPDALKFLNFTRRAFKASSTVAQDLGKASQYQPLADLLVGHRAVAAIHQAHHWQTRGGHYYSDHILFERLYNDVLGLIDPLAERAVGLGHWTLVDAATQTSAVARVVAGFPGSFESPEDMVEHSRQVTLMMVAAVEAVIQKLESTGSMTAGLEDLLPAQAAVYEGHGYLLGQRSR